MASSIEEIWQQEDTAIEELESNFGNDHETSFISPRGNEPLLGDNWARKPVPVPRQRLRGRSVISPCNSPEVMSPRTLSPALQQAFSPSRRQMSPSSSDSPIRPLSPESGYSPVRRPSVRFQQELSPIHKQAFSRQASPQFSNPSSPELQPVRRPSVRFEQELSPIRKILSPISKLTQNSPVHHVIAEVHASQDNASKIKETVIEMTETVVKETVKLSPLNPPPRRRKSPSNIVPHRRQSKSPSTRRTSQESLRPIPRRRSELLSSPASVIRPSSSTRADPNLEQKCEPEDFFLQSWSNEGAVSPDISASPSLALPQVGSPEHNRFTLAEYFGPGLSQLTQYFDPEDISSPSPGVLFSPSTKPVDLEVKLGSEGAVPQFPEEEGFYVGERPFVPYTIRNKIEQRIVAANHKNSKRWFGEDGELITIEDAVREIPLRPRLSDETPAAVLTHYREKEESSDVAFSIVDPLMLELELRWLQLTHHPLQNNEQRQGHQLQELYQQYKKRCSEGHAERLMGRLRALRHARDLMIEQERFDDPRLQKLHEEVREVRMNALREGAHDRSLLATLLNSWGKLRELRVQQKFTSCPLRLRVTRKPGSNRNHEEAEWTRETNDIISEMLQEQEWRGEDRSESEVRDLVHQLMRESKRPPGEPEVILELVDDVEIDPSPACPRERKRRKRVTLLHLSVAVMYNGQEVCGDIPCAFDDQFKVSFNLSLPLSACQWPRSVTLQLREKILPLLPAKILAEVILPLPYRGVTSASASDQIVSLNGRGQGSCVHSPCCLPHPTGNLKCRVAWGINPEGQILQPSDKYWANQGHSNVKNTKFPRNLEQLKTWVEQSKLDPNDPANAAILNQVKADGSTSGEDFNFCPEIPSDARLRVLELRARGETEFSTLKLVPPHERQLPPDVLKEFECRRERPESEHEDEAPPPADGSLVSHRVWGRKALRRVRARVQLQSRLASRRRQLRDLVTEDLVPDIGTLGLTMVQWLQPSRPLRPIRKPRQQLASLQGLEKEATLIINIVSAFQVPIRRDLDVNTAGSAGSSVGSPGFCTVAVRPFVEVTLQDSSQRTAAAEGANPTWNQELQLPIKLGCGYEDRLTVSLYDEVTTDVLEDERLRGIDTHMRHERAWLGSLTFPLAALQLTSRIDGTFPVSCIPLLGYEREPPLRQFSSPPALDSPPSPLRNSLEDTSTFITVFITVQPALQQHFNVQARLECSESPEVEQQLEAWQGEVMALFPERRVRALVAGPTGLAVCITKFIRPIAPPQALLEGSDGPVGTRIAADRVARLVSLISAADPGPGHDVWLPADHALMLGICDPVPRAALLACLFQGLGLKSWLLFGWGPTSGSEGGFVLTRGGWGDEPWVWDVSTATRTKLDDPFCPVQLVWALANQENVWANIQRDAGSRRLRVDVTRNSDWLAAFPVGGPVAAPDISVQPAMIGWTLTSQDMCTELADMLEGQLRDAFATWRPNLRTRWNRHCAAVLRRVLPVLEQQAQQQTGGATSSKDPARELQPLLGAHKMLGFPFHMCYTDESAILRTLHNTYLHEARDPEVEFALAVYVAPHHCRLVSLWVYAAALIRRR